MDLQQLVRSRAIEPVQVPAREIAGLLGVARRDIRTAQTLTSADLDWAFIAAYNAVLQLSLAYMNSLGYRPRGEGHHYNTYRFMEIALPDETVMVKRLQKLRKKRNNTLYEQAGTVSEQEALDVIAFAARYYEKIWPLLPEEVREQGPQEEL